MHSKNQENINSLSSMYYCRCVSKRLKYKQPNFSGDIKNIENNTINSCMKK